jgi:hypothetical protein
MRRLIAFIPNPVGTTCQSCPHPQPLSQAWERGAGAGGDGGVRAIQQSGMLSTLSIILLDRPKNIYSE